MEKHIFIVKGKKLSFRWNKEVKHVKKKASNRIKMQKVFVVVCGWSMFQVKIELFCDLIVEKVNCFYEKSF